MDTNLLASVLPMLSGLPRPDQPSAGPMPAQPVMGTPNLPPMAQAPMAGPRMPQMPQQPQRPKRSGSDALLQLTGMLLPMILGGKDPRQTALAYSGFLSGQQRAHDERIDAAEREQQRKEKVAMLVRQAAADAQQFEDPEQFARYLDAYGRVIQGVDPSFDPSTLRQAVAFPASKLAKKTQAEAAAKVAELQKLYGPNFEQVAQTASVTFKGKPTKVADLMNLAELQLTTDTGPVGLPQANVFGSTSDLEQGLKAEFDAFQEANGRPPNAAERRTLYYKAQEDLAKAKTAGKPVDKPTAGSFEHYMTATPEERKAIEQARKGYMQADDRPRVTVDVGGLNPKVQTAVAGIQRRYDANPVVKRTATMAEAVDFVNNLPANTTNPADDQALIYAFAKGMDPESVVREGEYATVQKYAQSWLSTFGFNAQRVISNSEFLTPQARKNMKDTIQRRFQATKGQYDNVRRTFGNELNRLTGSTNGLDHLVDYAPGGQAAPAPAAGGTTDKKPTLRFNPATGKLEPIR